jgi:hypothetical protein
MAVGAGITAGTTVGAGGAAGTGGPGADAAGAITTPTAAVGTDQRAER